MASSLRTSDSTGRKRSSNSSPDSRQRKPHCRMQVATHTASSRPRTSFRRAGLQRTPGDSRFHPSRDGDLRQCRSHREKCVEAWMGDALAGLPHLKTADQSYPAIRLTRRRHDSSARSVCPHGDQDKAHERVRRNSLRRIQTVPPLTLPRRKPFPTDHLETKEPQTNGPQQPK